MSEVKSLPGIVSDYLGYASMGVLAAHRGSQLAEDIYRFIAKKPKLAPYKIGNFSGKTTMALSVLSMPMVISHAATAIDHIQSGEYTCDDIYALSGAIFLGANLATALFNPKSRLVQGIKLATFIGGVAVDVAGVVTAKTKKDFWTQLVMAVLFNSERGGPARALTKGAYDLVTSHRRPATGDQNQTSRTWHPETISKLAAGLLAGVLCTYSPQAHAATDPPPPSSVPSPRDGPVPPAQGGPIDVLAPGGRRRKSSVEIDLDAVHAAVELTIRFAENYHFFTPEEEMVKFPAEAHPVFLMRLIERRYAREVADKLEVIPSTGLTDEVAKQLIGKGYLAQVASQAKRFVGLSEETTGLITEHNHQVRVKKAHATLYRLGWLSPGEYSALYREYQALKGDPIFLQTIGDPSKLAEFYVSRRRYRSLAWGMKLAGFPFPLSEQEASVRLATLMRHGDCYTAMGLYKAMGMAGIDRSHFNIMDLQRRAFTEKNRRYHGRVERKERPTIDIAQEVVSFYLRQVLFQEYTFLMYEAKKHDLEFDHRDLVALGDFQTRMRSPLFVRWLRKTIITLVDGELQGQYELGTPLEGVRPEVPCLPGETRVGALLKRGTEEEIRHYLYEAQVRFNQRGWSAALGGDAWAIIAELGEALWRDNDLATEIILLDRAFQLEHNAGPLIEKLEGTMDVRTVQKLLDIKKGDIELPDGTRRGLRSSELLEAFGSDFVTPAIRKLYLSNLEFLRILRQKVEAGNLRRRYLGD